MKNLVKLLLPFVLSCVSSLPAAEETTQSYLSKFGDKLSGVWASYPAEKDALIRRQKISDLTTSMVTDLKALDAPKEQTLGKVFSNLMSNLEKARGLFRLEKMNSERTSYINACTEAFKREMPFATDADKERHASKCFDQLMTWADDARPRMRSLPDDAHAAVFTNLNEIFQLMIKSASKDPGDPSAVYEQEIKELQRRYPVSTPALQQANTPARSLLEGAAKKVLDVNKKP